MTHCLTHDIGVAVACLEGGEVLAYPTEACYGLGCDPGYEQAVQKILRIKQRDWRKGLILIASDYEQLAQYVDPTDIDLQPVFASWPGPVTWILPAAPGVSEWLKGEHTGIAVRVSAHPVVQRLCKAYGKAIVSTSANRAGQVPLLTANEVQDEFGPNEIDCILQGALGDLDKPTSIIDALSGRRLR